jgi:hypothetical protein
MIRIKVLVGDGADRFLARVFEWPVLPRAGENLYLLPDGSITGVVESVWHELTQSPPIVIIELDVSGDVFDELCRSDTGWKCGP